MSWKICYQNIGSNKLPWIGKIKKDMGAYLILSPAKDKFYRVNTGACSTQTFGLKKTALKHVNTR